MSQACIHPDSSMFERLDVQLETSSKQCFSRVCTGTSVNIFLSKDNRIFYRSNHLSVLHGLLCRTYIVTEQQLHTFYLNSTIPRDANSNLYFKNSALRPLIGFLKNSKLDTDEDCILVSRLF